MKLFFIGELRSNRVSDGSRWRQYSKAVPVEFQTVFQWLPALAGDGIKKVRRWSMARPANFLHALFPLYSLLFFLFFPPKVTHLARLYPLVTCYTLLYWLVSRSIDPLLGSGPSFFCFFSIPLPLESQFQGPNSSLEAGGPDICSRPKSKSQCPNPSLKPQILASRLVFGPQD